MNMDAHSAALLGAGFAGIGAGMAAELGGMVVTQ